MDAASFLCQRCGVPIRMDPEFNALSELTVAELSLPVFPTCKSEFVGKSSAFDRSNTSFRMREIPNGNNGFMLVNGSGDQEALSHHFRITAELMDLMSSTSDVDHPVCQDCCEALLDMLEGELQKAETDLKAYKSLQARLTKERQERRTTGGRSETHELKKKLNDMRDAEKDLLLQLKELQLDGEVVDRELADLEKERERLTREEEQYFKEYAKYKQEALRLEDETRSVESQLRYTQSQLDKLKKTTVFSATFHIWSSKHFGCINGFRLGRLPDQPVEWWEINAAWGQTALLLSSLAAKRSLTFQKYKIVPYGNYSYIQVLDDSRILNLYGSGSFRTGIFSDRVFDQGMVAFLDCLQQFKVDMERSGTLRLPHAIDRDRGRIDDGGGNWYSIKIQFNSEEQWTKALKFMLVNLKWALTCVSAQIVESEVDDASAD